MDAGIHRAKAEHVVPLTMELTLKEPGPRLPPLSRRGVLSAAAVTPAWPRWRVCGEGALTARCSEWWALDAEVNHLTTQRSIAEAAVLRKFGKLQRLPSDDPVTSRLGWIDGQFEALDQRKTRCIAAIGTLPARTVEDVAHKLAIVARLLNDEGGLESEIVDEAARFLSRDAVRT
ncbi:hypothetical protein [Brevundimonas sp.]|uniref:hypothetical protein n=1 Tax=Brevundimonas sp. TaxID=1871086 RepID=UPI002BFFFE77|nr:hypothetical protein [Brevundimonas sp.]HWQ86891.1 hypothetical protein [Brevundimonas sp.]